MFNMPSRTSSPKSTIDQAASPVVCVMESLEGRAMLSAAPVLTGPLAPLASGAILAAANQNPTAVINATPTQGQAPLDVKFSGTQSHDPDGDTLSFLWDFGDGSQTETGANVEHTFNSRGVFNVQLTVSDGNGGADTTTTQILVGETVPQPQIFMPSADTFVAGGSKLFFGGNASDAEDGFIPTRSFTWTLSRVRADGTARVLRTVRDVRSGRLRIPGGGNADPNVVFRLTLAVTDSTGLTGTTSVDLKPQVAPLNVLTTFPGLKISVDGVLRDPGAIPSMVGMARTVSAPVRQVINGNTYIFERWTDGGARTHRVRIGPGGGFVVPIYRLASPAGAPAPLFGSSALTGLPGGQATGQQPSIFNANSPFGGDLLQRSPSSVFGS